MKAEVTTSKNEQTIFIFIYIKLSHENLELVKKIKK